MIRGTSAIVGAAVSRLGRVPGATHLELTAEAVHAALTDAALPLHAVDGLFGCNMLNLLPSITLAEYFGLQPRYVDSTNIGGASFIHHLTSAALALDAGLCSVALIAYGSNQLSGAGRMVLPETLPLESGYDVPLPVTGYALAAARHMHEYGTTRRQLAEVAVSARRWAQLNPAAMLREPLSAEQVLGARMVADPLTVRDCCLVSDGAAAIVLMRADEARDRPRPPVYVLGTATELSHRHIGQMPDVTRSAATRSAARAFSAAGASLGDVDVVQLYDAFTINVIMFLEDLGFCPKGEGGGFIEGGRIAPGGTLPVNTNGGGLSCVHTGMYGLFELVEATLQLRGEAGERQVKGAELALCHANGGMFSSQATAVLGAATTL
jgi:acetyl-CoA acetyltransferase